MKDEARKLETQLDKMLEAQAFVTDNKVMAQYADLFSMATAEIERCASRMTKLVDFKNRTYLAAKEEPENAVVAEHLHRHWHRQFLDIRGY